MNIDPGKYCGNATINRTTCEIFVKGEHFGQVFNNKFLGHVKQSKLRKAGIFTPDKKRKKVYGKFGYIGCPKR